jgi:hypothetical protein
LQWTFLAWTEHGFLWSFGGACEISGIGSVEAQMRADLEAVFRDQEASNGEKERKEEDCQVNV